MFKAPAIVIAAYNRPKALKRILNSLEQANYNGHSNIPLIISIDGGGSNYEHMIQIASNYQWPFGEIQIKEYHENIGLRRHIISCGDLTGKYGSAIILEEDCYVSRNFYHYTCNAINYYSSDSSIAGISLYADTCNELSGVPFLPLYDGYDVYFKQVPCSWGQAWTSNQWNRFKEYYNTNPSIQNDDLFPEKAKQWPESSWKKYFYKYMLINDLYFVYPQVSFSTNFGDAGTHHTNNTQMFQVPLEHLTRNKKYQFVDFTKSNNKYDAYSEILPECIIKLGVKINEDTCIDLSGAKPFHLFSNKFALSVKKCSKSTDSFSNELLPPVMNIIKNKKGNFFHYGNFSDFEDFSKNKYYDLVKKHHVLAFSSGEKLIRTTKNYKLGSYLLKPTKISDLFRKKLRSKINAK